MTMDLSITDICTRADQSLFKSCSQAPEVEGGGEGAKEALQRNPEANLKITGIDTETWHKLAENATGWRQAVKRGVRSFEAERLKARADKSQKRKAKKAQDIEVKQIPVSTDFVCQMCGIACKSRIGLYSHSRTHPRHH